MRQRRGYTTQCADASKPLQSVRRLVWHNHVVVFDEEGSFISNKKTGEVNAITDDDINYTMQVWVVPPAYIQALREQAAAEEAAGFTLPAPP